MARFTIGKVAEAARVNIETVRYYEKRGMIDQPPARGTFREYPKSVVDRIQFIKRAQELGFTLAEIKELLLLADSPQSDRKAARDFGVRKVASIRAKIADLQAIEQMLVHLVDECSGHGPIAECPIIEALANPGATTTKREK